MVGHKEYFVVRDVIYKYLPPTVRRTDRTSRDIITYTVYLLHVLQWVPGGLIQPPQLPGDNRRQISGWFRWGPGRRAVPNPSEDWRVGDRHHPTSCSSPIITPSRIHCLPIKLPARVAAPRARSVRRRRTNPNHNPNPNPSIYRLSIAPVSTHSQK